MHNKRMSCADIDIFGFHTFTLEFLFIKLAGRTLIESFCWSPSKELLGSIYRAPITTNMLVALHATGEALSSVQPIPMCGLWEQFVEAF